MEVEATRAVAVLSSLLCCASLLTVVSLAVILTHWHDALDACAHADCGCLLYARVTTSTFSITGSDVSLCWFSGTAPLPGLVVALSLAAWYGYRGFILSPQQRQHRRAIQGARGADGSGVRFLGQGQAQGAAGAAVVTPRSSPAAGSPKSARRLTRTATFVTMQGAVCLLFGLFSVSHVAVLTDGFLTACREYRHAVLKTLKASGNLALLVNERLTCPVIFDFLDYMKPDVRETFQGNNHWFPGQRRLTTVNTAAALVISLVAAFSCMLLWFALAFKFGAVAQKMARRSREVTQVRRSRAQFAMHCTDL